MLKKYRFYSRLIYCYNTTGLKKFVLNQKMKMGLKFCLKSNEAWQINISGFQYDNLKL